MKSKKDLELPTEADLNEWFDDLFSPCPRGKKKENAALLRATRAFENLTGFFLWEGYCLGDMKNAELFDGIQKRIVFDYVGLMSLLKWFQRDAYGVQNFVALTDALQKRGKITKGAQRTIIKAVCALGLRITAEEPRKTRIAAAFSLWMCVFRPISIERTNLAMSAERIEHICANLNYWLASTFLLKFGTITLGDKDESQIRMRRIRHDFTVRQVSMSTMETLYGAIFRRTHSKKKRQTRGPVLQP